MCCRVWEPENECFRAAPPPKKTIFLLENGLKMPISGQNSVFLGVGWSLQGPPALFCKCLTQENMCCNVGKPKNGCFRVAPPKKWPFFAQKWPRNANFGPKTVFSGLGWPVLGPSHAIFQVPDSNKHVLQGMKAGKSVLHGRPTQKMAIFAQKWPTNANFGAKTVFFGLGWAVLGPQHPISLVPDQKKMCCRVWAGNWVFHRDPPPPQKSPFLPKNGHFWPKIGLKMPILGQKQCFLGLGSDFKTPPTVLCRCLTKKRNTCCRVQQSENKCFNPPPSKKASKKAIFTQKMA